MDPRVILRCEDHTTMSALIMVVDLNLTTGKENQECEWHLDSKELSHKRNPGVKEIELHTVKGLKLHSGGHLL